MSANTPPLRLGTRASPLAMAQAEMARHALIAAHGWHEDQVTIIAQVADGDRIVDRPLAGVGGKALWTKGLDRMLVEGKIDFAVHSMKDVETVRPPEIALAAVLERADPRDRIIGADSIDALRAGAHVGTSSPRRAAQLRRLRPDLDIVMFRGNVATRLAKLEAGEADATLLAAAGLDRLGLGGTGRAIAIEDMLPASAQGAVGIEARADDREMLGLLAAIDDRPTRDCVESERALLAALNADCHSPVGAHARFVGGALHLTAEILSEDGKLHVRNAVVIENGSTPEMLARALLQGADPALRALFGG